MHECDRIHWSVAYSLGQMILADSIYKDELLEKIVNICSQSKYKYLSDFEWYAL